MSSFERMTPKFDQFQQEVRKAKNASGHTIQELSDGAGVPLDFASSVSAGNAKRPSLFYSAAVCDYLGLSLDLLLGINCDDADTVRDLKVKNSALQTSVNHYEALAAVYKPLIFMLIGVCALLLCAVIGYIIFDIRMTQVGLFQSAGMSVLAVFLALVVLAAVALIAYTAKMIIQSSKHQESKRR